MNTRPRYVVALFLALYLYGCIHYPEPDDTAPVLCDDGTPPTSWCGCDAPILGDDC